MKHNVQNKARVQSWDFQVSSLKPYHYANLPTTFSLAQKTFTLVHKGNLLLIKWQMKDHFIKVFIGR